ncbi:MAG: iron-only hydrogenase system regulator [Clostridia bacterium]|nr:iron-only hydrogenase system regulator [Clostridia bacterium]
MESENRIAVVGILISDGESVESVNAALHDMSEFVRGRMGLPLRDRNLNAITLVLDAPADAINRLAGRLGKISGVSAKVMYR